MDSLKDAVSERHARMEALPFIAALTSGVLPLVSYVGQLRAMAVIHGTLEHELALMESDEVRLFLVGRPSRLVHLRKDLSLFDPRFIPDIEGALPTVRRIAEQIRLYRVGRPTDLLGILYVLEGMTLGNTAHLPDVLRGFGNQTTGLAYYYEGYGQDTAANWRAFCGAMNGFPLDLKSRERIIQVALACFDQLEVLYSALYPIQDSEMIFTAGMLNPEAGDHAVPQDAREIEAAVLAAGKCREEFPYFEERYQERGRGFAKSDAAWLAALVELPASEVLSQVDWLGRVLANRGIPRITLERQLELLHDELASAMPEQAARYQVLPEAAHALKRERLMRLPEPLFNDLALAFSRATDGELQGRFKGTGTLLVAAVCDQEAGITEAVSSLQSWLTDAERFAPAWIAAVLETLAQAREAVAVNRRKGATP
jgi:heme oxygenase